MEENNEVQYVPKKTKKTGLIVGIIIGVTVFIAVLIIVLVLLLGGKKENKEDKRKEKNAITSYSTYRLSNKEVSKFDLAFLKTENPGKNSIYSPLSIKYALLMLNEGTNGNSKKQIASIVGDYTPKNYINNNNRSFANALFIKNSFKESVLETYVNSLKNSYNAEVIYDSFETPKTLNSWVSDKTFGLIKDLFDDVSDKDFILVNALAIDMEWKEKIQPENREFEVDFKREKFNTYVAPLSSMGYGSMNFDTLTNRKAVKFAAVANRYDIVKDLGEENIRKTVTDEYNKWASNGGDGCDPVENTSTFVDKYMEEIKGNYGYVGSSTDFLFYDDDEVKVFAKDLKEYDGTTLQYVGIMPKEKELTAYVNEVDETKVNNIIKNLKDISLDSFDDNTITYVHGDLPLFNFEYELKLKEDLIKLGISDVFDQAKADLSKLTKSKNAFIASASHKANIEFSNDGIKAAAATQLGGLGGIMCGFEYDFEVPIKEIDLTFDKPYMFLIRDKDTGEVWFIGTVYEPVEYEEPSYNW